MNTLRITGIGLLAALSLGSCAPQGESSAPIVRTSPDGQPGLTSLELTARTDINITKGPGVGTRQSVANQRNAYLIQNGEVSTRTDLDGQLFADQQARRVYVSPQGRVQVRLMNGQADTTIREDQLKAAGETLRQSAQGLLSLTDAKAPFKRMSAEQFSTLARQQSFDATGTTPNVYTRTQVMGDSKVTTRLTFDAAIGAVSATESVRTSPTQEVSASTAITYATPSGTDLMIPASITTETTSTLKGDLAKAPVELPVSDQKLKTNAPIVGPDEFVATQFTSAPGEGLTDINTQVVTSTTTFSEIKMNRLSATDFQEGLK